MAEKKHPPGDPMTLGNMRLTEFCTTLSASENLLKLVDTVTIRKPSSVDKRGVALCLIIMAGAGHFVGTSLRWDEHEGMKGIWEGSRRYLRDTNLDVITAEAMVWMHFLMGNFWKAEKEKHHEMFGRLVTIPTAALLALDMIRDQTGFDFRARWLESRKLYLDATKHRTDSGAPWEPFATIVLRSVGCRSLAEPLRTVALPPPEFTPLTDQVSIFFSTVPSALYETFKRFLMEWSDRFPYDDEE